MSLHSARENTLFTVHSVTATDGITNNRTSSLLLLFHTSLGLILHNLNDYLKATAEILHFAASSRLASSARKWEFKSTTTNLCIRLNPVHQTCRRQPLHNRSADNNSPSAFSRRNIPNLKMASLFQNISLALYVPASTTNQQSTNINRGTAPFKEKLITDARSKISLKNSVHFFLYYKACLDHEEKSFPFSC